MPSAPASLAAVESLPQPERLRDGASFILDAPRRVPAVFGRGDDVLWATGEPLFVVGPQGTGKTTLAQQLALRRAGVHGGDLLGMPVEVDPGRVLYIAADRPQQAARSFRRMVGREDRQSLGLGLWVWSGPLPFDLGRSDPGLFAEFVAGFPEVGTVIVDSLKDVALGLSDDEVGSRVNAAHQTLVASGVELAVVHHQRKAGAENKRPRKLDDVYGSTWLTAGAGSVLLLWGEPGDPVVELRHLKQPVADVGPLTLEHDQGAGVTRIREQVDLAAALTRSPAGITAKKAAVLLSGSDKPTPAEVQKARRRLDRLVANGSAERDDASDIGAEVRYREKVA